MKQSADNGDKSSETRMPLGLRINPVNAEPSLRQVGNHVARLLSIPYDWLNSPRTWLGVSQLCVRILSIMLSTVADPRQGAALVHISRSSQTDVVILCPYADRL